jgi:hypothetical protein
MPEAKDGQDRLDSWKAIAEYLRRDLATVRRWEKELGLPVRRVPGARRGHSVYAYTSEIDAWLRASPDPSDQGIAPPGAPTSKSRWLAWAVAGSVLAVAVGALIWQATSTRPSAEELRIEVTPAGVFARNPKGDLRWQHAFPTSAVVYVAGQIRSSRTFSTEPPGVLVWTMSSESRIDRMNESGEVMWFDPGGTLRRTFAFADRVTMRGETFEPPWVLTDIAAQESGDRRRIAVAGRHITWEPSLVTVLDDNWVRRGTFLHAGWIEHVSWLAPDRLLVAGFSQEQDGGMIAIMPADGVDLGVPEIMIVMPRSEVNIAAVARFNGAVVERVAKRVVVRTIELVDDPAQGAADAIYEFDEALTLRSATYSTRYWDAHQSLERQGKLNHSRDQCPDRAGPESIFVWKPPAKWAEVPTR